jgi:Tfp pilus assembly protein PilV
MNVAKSNVGFSVLEVLIAFAVLAIGLLGVGSMLMTSMKTDQYTTQMLYGDESAVDQIEYLKGIAPDSTLINRDGKTGGEVTIQRKGVDVVVPAYVYHVEVTANNPTTNIDRVDITIGWGGENCISNPKNCKYTTKITNFVPKKGL